MTQTNRLALKYSADGRGWYDGFAGFYLVLGVPERVRKKQEAERKFQEAKQQQSDTLMAEMMAKLEQIFERQNKALQQIFER